MIGTLPTPNMPPIDSFEYWKMRSSVRVDLPCRYSELVGRAFIDTTYRIYAVVGTEKYLEGSYDRATALLPVLYIPRDYGAFHRNDIQAVVPGIIEQFRSSGGFEAVAGFDTYRARDDDRLWEIAVPDGTELKLVHPGNAWKLLSEESLLDEHFVYIPRLPGNYVPVRTVLQEAGKIDAYAARMIEAGAYRRAADLVAPRDLAAEDGLQFVYRLKDKDGVLLYIGVTGNVAKRKIQHARVQPWWGDVASTVVQCFDSREAAEAAEAAAIVSENPVHNRKAPTPAALAKLTAAVTGNPGGSFRAAELLAEKDRTIEQLRQLVQTLETRLDETEVFTDFVEECLEDYLPEGNEEGIRDVMVRVTEKVASLIDYTGRERPLGVHPSSAVPQMFLPDAA